MTRLPMLHALLSSLVAASSMACGTGSCPPEKDEIVAIDPQATSLAQSFQRCEIDASDCEDLCRGVYKLMYGADVEEYAFFSECELVDLDGMPAVHYVVSQQCLGGRLPAGAVLADDKLAASEAGAWFAKLAELEEASVYAFVMLSKELRRFGAPPELSARCLAAAADEVQHARLVQALAKRFGAELAPIAAPTLAADRSLAEVAIENAREGCVRETFGALLALWQAQHSEDRLVRRVMSRIAIDESRHAELSADIDSWARSVLESTQIEALDQTKEQAIAGLRESVRAEFSDELVSLVGLPDAASGMRLFRSAEREVWA